MFKKLEEFLEKITKNNNNHTSRDEFLDEMGGCLPDDLREALNHNDHQDRGRGSCRSIAS